MVHNSEAGKEGFEILKGNVHQSKSECKNGQDIFACSPYCQLESFSTINLSPLS